MGGPWTGSSSLKTTTATQSGAGNSEAGDRVVENPECGVDKQASLPRIRVPAAGSTIFPISSKARELPGPGQPE